jgi:hypothetical protein
MASKPPLNFPLLISAPQWYLIGTLYERGAIRMPAALAGNSPAIRRFPAAYPGRAFADKKESPISAKLSGTVKTVPHVILKAQNPAISKIL